VRVVRVRVRADARCARACRACPYLPPSFPWLTGTQQTSRLSPRLGAVGRVPRASQHMRSLCRPAARTRAPLPSQLRSAWSCLAVPDHPLPRSNARPCSPPAASASASPAMRNTPGCPSPPWSQANATPVTTPSRTGFHTLGWSASILLPLLLPEGGLPQKRKGLKVDRGGVAMLLESLLSLDTVSSGALPGGETTTVSLDDAPWSAAIPVALPCRILSRPGSLSHAHRQTRSVPPAGCGRAHRRACTTMCSTTWTRRRSTFTTASRATSRLTRRMIATRPPTPSPRSPATTARVIACPAGIPPSTRPLPPAAKSTLCTTSQASAMALRTAQVLVVPLAR
jgi:hypothetical protein